MSEFPPQPPPLSLLVPLLAPTFYVQNWHRCSTSQAQLWWWLTLSHPRLGLTLPEAFVGLLSRRSYRFDPLTLLGLRI
jgi:hypothetical protein